MNLTMAVAGDPLTLPFVSITKMDTEPLYQISMVVRRNGERTTRSICVTAEELKLIGRAIYEALELPQK